MSDIQLIKDKIDVVDFITEYVQLKPAGVNHKGLCPFHQEKSPSFMVNRERQRWHCFGCSKGGDIFTFVEEIEGMDFIEALKFLANRAGVQLTRQTSDVGSSQKNRLKDINTEAARFFHKFLLQLPIAESARNYLKQRGLTDETIEEWQIGYVSDQWDLLTKYLLKKGFSIDDLVASGLTIKRDHVSVPPIVGTAPGKSVLKNITADNVHGFYDRFRGRVMFPIWDVHGTVVGFTGRVLIETEHSGGKYVNTPQTPLYDKSRVVFGLNKAKQEIRAKNQIVMVEGQMDVIACHQAGMKNVIATSGTALTEYQVQLLKRYANTVAIAFDADAAGQAAAKRGIDIALAEGMNIKVIRIPEGAGKDPDECIKKDKAVWFRAVDKAVDIMEWYFSRAFTGKRLTDPKDKQTIVNDILPEILRIPYAIERDHWLRELSSRLGVDTAVLREDMDRIKKKLETGNSKLGPGQIQKQGDSSLSKPNVESRLVGTANNQESNLSHRLELLFERLLVVTLRFPTQFPISNFQFLDKLSPSKYFPLYKAIKEQYTTLGAIDSAVLRNNIFPGDDSASQVDILLMKGELDFASFTDKDAVGEIEQLVHQIRTEWVHEERKRIQQAIEQAEKAGDKDAVQVLLRNFQDIQ